MQGGVGILALVSGKPRMFSQVFVVHVHWRHTSWMWTYSYAAYLTRVTISIVNIYISLRFSQTSIILCTCMYVSVLFLILSACFSSCVYITRAFNLCAVFDKSKNVNLCCQHTSVILSLRNVYLWKVDLVKCIYHIYTAFIIPLTQQVRAKVSVWMNMNYTSKQREEQLLIFILILR